MKHIIIFKVVGFYDRTRFLVEEFVELGARRVVDLDQSVPFLWLFRPQEVQRFLDGSHLFFGTAFTPVVGDDRDDSWAEEQKNENYK